MITRAAFLLFLTVIGSTMTFLVGLAAYEHFRKRGKKPDKERLTRLNPGICKRETTSDENLISRRGRCA